MRPPILIIFPLALAAGLAAGATAAGATAAAADGAGPPPAARHGGTLTTTPAHTFETVMAADGVRVFLLTDEAAPAMVEKAAGTAVLKLPGGRSLEVALVRREPAAGESATYFCPMHAEVVQDEPGTCEPCGGMTLFEQDFLFGAADLKGLDLAGIGVMIRLSGLRGPEKEATFSPAFPTPDTKAAAMQSGT